MDNVNVNIIMRDDSIMVEHKSLSDEAIIWEADDGGYIAIGYIYENDEALESGVKQFQYLADAMHFAITWVEQA